jgi:hypothetical protein
MQTTNFKMGLPKKSVTEGMFAVALPMNGSFSMFHYSFCHDTSLRSSVSAVKCPEDSVCKSLLKQATNESVNSRLSAKWFPLFSGLSGCTDVG